MGLGSHYVSSPGFCFSTKDYNKWLNDYYHNTDNSDDVEKLIPEWFYLPYCDDCKEYGEFKNNVCSYQPTHRVLLSCVICENVNLGHYSSYQHNPTCYYECYVKYNTKPCIDCQKPGLSLRCAPCYTLLKQKLENCDPKELRKLVNKHKKKKEKRIYNK